MNFEADEIKLKKDLWTLVTVKLIKEMQLSDQYKDKTDLKKEKKEHRLYSDTVKLMYDDGLSLSFSMSKKRSRREETLDLSSPDNYFIQNG